MKLFFIQPPLFSYLLPIGNPFVFILFCSIEVAISGVCI